MVKVRIKKRSNQKNEVVDFHPLLPKENENPRQRKERLFPSWNNDMRLAKGIVEEEEEQVETVRPSEDEIYRQSKVLQGLERQIEEKRRVLSRLEKKIAQKGCKKPSMEDLLRTCSAISDSAKGNLSPNVANKKS